MKTSMKWMIAALWMMTSAWVARAGDTLSIQGSDTFSQELGPPLISAFQGAYTNISVELTGLGSASGIAGLLAYRRRR